MALVATHAPAHLNEQQPVLVLSTAIKCSIDSPQEFQTIVLAAQIAATLTTGFMCPLCQQTFALRKSLIRHIKGVVRHHQGSEFVCVYASCGMKFSRKDVLVRHEAFKHNQMGSKVRCDVCRQYVRPRSLKGHKMSEACKRIERTLNATAAGDLVAANSVTNHDPNYIDSDFTNPATLSLEYMIAENISANAAAGQLVQFYGQQTPSLSSSSTLQGPLDFILLSARLFAQTSPWGRGQESSNLWLNQAMVDRTYEIENLKHKIFPLIRTACAATDIASNAALLDALALLMITINWTDGWAATAVHQQAVIELGACQIQANGLSKARFLDYATTEPFYSVIFQGIRESERRKCETVIHMTTRMIRDGAFEYTSRLTQQHRMPLHPRAAFLHSHYLTAERWVAEYGMHALEIAQLAGTIGDVVKT